MRGAENLSASANVGEAATINAGGKTRRGAMFTAAFNRIEADHNCQACELESGRVTMKAVYEMTHTDSTGTRQYSYCYRHANRIAVDMAITGNETTIDGEPIALPIPYDVKGERSEYKSRWATAHEEAKRVNSSYTPNQSSNTKQQSKPASRPRQTKAPPKQDGFEWI